MSSEKKRVQFRTPDRADALTREIAAAYDDDISFEELTALLGAEGAANVRVLKRQLDEGYVEELAELLTWALVGGTSGLVGVGIASGESPDPLTLCLETPIEAGTSKAVKDAHDYLPSIRESQLLSLDVRSFSTSLAIPGCASRYSSIIHTEPDF